ncbi:MFS transporter, NNP family, nitrate/nitrite transporter [Marinobacter daqiaonensis]|uniref:MFS transporter, NNP family, nitrate/nitrite transporter n=1 Tax=Marinobacter daqiaonensis TaxID=650891 RepID=A0A1I6HRM6_9GAMM|nr:nitrate/nitrite transporter [Marinobacter daqiaonensis]SFR57102.1 MFS transporter, NNP family, nitrate/nitrite transporter [Marinobacter daqiaonensis]
MTSIASRAEQNRALGLSTLAFTLCFAAWTIFSIIGISIRQEFGLSDTQLGLLMATPILTGSVSRLFLGLWTDRFGGRWLFGTLMLTTAAFVYLLTYAVSYQMLLLTALGMGFAGGAFMVGIAYTATWLEPERQGRAFGIFGAGNVGAAVTHLGAPFLLVSMSWEDTARVYAAVLAIMGVLFILLARENPAGRSRTGTLPFIEQMSPVKDLRVWHFALYYFFVFGAFVALALWLPYYLVGVYGLDMTTAGLIAAFYSIPASLLRILGSRVSDRYGARRVMYWTFIASVICTFLLSYPPTAYVVHGIDGDVRFVLEVGLIPFVVLMFVLGFFMSLGKAAVYKHIPVYYPGDVAAVGGVVGMIGGLGGFFLLLAFGILTDLTGVWQSSFMMLFAIASAALLWMHHAIRKAERNEWANHQTRTDLPELASPQLFHPQKKPPERNANMADKNSYHHS